MKQHHHYIIEFFYPNSNKNGAPITWYISDESGNYTNMKVEAMLWEKRADALVCVKKLKAENYYFYEKFKVVKVSEEDFISIDSNHIKRDIARRIYSLKDEKICNINQAIETLIYYISTFEIRQKK